MSFSKLVGMAITGIGLWSGLVSANPTLTPGVWTEITPAALKSTISSGSLVTYDIEIDPSNPSTLYANTNGTGNAKLIWKTTDGGSNWTNIGNFGGVTNGIGFGRIRIDPKNSQHLYTGIEMGQVLAQEGFWVSTDGGNNWTQPAGWTTLCQSVTAGNFNDVYDLAVDPTDFNHVLAASRSWVGNVAESKDGGATWKSITIPGVNGQDFNIDFLSSPKLGIGNGNTWLVSSPEGIWRTSDAGSNWVKNSTSYQIMYHTGIYYAKTGAVYVGGYPMPLRSTDNGVTWQQLTNGLSLFGSYFIIVGDGSTLYTAHTNVWTFPNSGPVQISPESDGVAWTNYQPSGTAQQLTNGPLAMTYDTLNHIMYSSNLYGYLALKIAGSTNLENRAIEQSAVSANRGKGRAFASVSNRFALSAGCSTVNLFNVEGVRIGTRQVTRDGRVQIGAGISANQAIIVKSR